MKKIQKSARFYKIKEQLTLLRDNAEFTVDAFKVFSYYDSASKADQLVAAGLSYTLERIKRIRG